jgi:hypothetical protein
VNQRESVDSKSQSTSETSDSSSNSLLLFKEEELENTIVFFNDSSNKLDSNNSQTQCLNVNNVQKSSTDNCKSSDEKLVHVEIEEQPNDHFKRPNSPSSEDSNPASGNGGPSTEQSVFEKFLKSFNSINNVNSMEPSGTKIDCNAEKDKNKDNLNKIIDLLKKSEMKNKKTSTHKANASNLLLAITSKTNGETTQPSDKINTLMMVNTIETSEQMTPAAKLTTFSDENMSCNLGF